MLDSEYTGARFDIHPLPHLVAQQRQRFSKFTRLALANSSSI